MIAPLRTREGAVAPPGLVAELSVYTLPQQRLVLSAKSVEAVVSIRGIAGCDAEIVYLARRSAESEVGTNL